MKKCILCFLFLVAVFSCSGKTIALFEKPEQGSRFLVIDSSAVSDTSVWKRQVVNMHPVCRVYEFSGKMLPGGVPAWERPDIAVKPDGKTLKAEVPFPLLHAAGAVFCAVLILFILFRRLVQKKENAYELFLIPALLRIILVLCCREYGVFPAATDEPGYFRTVADMLQGQWRNQWSFTVGTGFFYLPFVLLLNAKEFFDIVPLFNYFSGIFIAPACLYLCALVLKKLQVSVRVVCCAMLFWAVYPLFCYHLEDWNALHFQQFFNVPSWLWQFDRWFYYAFCINSGFNAMSDIPALFLMFCSLYTLFAAPEKKYAYVLSGALFGFACLVRINYILLAPAFSLVLLHFRGGLNRTFFAALGMAAAAFFAVFSVQLVCNSIQFGSPFTFGYVLHYTQNIAAERPSSGWTWHTFSKLTHLRYLFAVNLPFFALGTAALWVIRDRFKQAFFVLLSVPVVLFFCGYSHTFCDGRRFVFPAFAGLLMALAALELWKELPRRLLFEISAGLSLMLLFTLPHKAFWKGLPFRLGDGLFLRLAGALIPVFLFIVIFKLIRNRAYPAAVFTFLSALFYYGPVELTAAGMFCLLPYLLLRDVISAKIKGMIQLAPGSEDLSGKEE